MAKYVYERWDYFYEVEPADTNVWTFSPKLRRVLKNGELEETNTTSPEPMSAYYNRDSNIDSYNSGSAVNIYTGERGKMGGTSYIYHPAKSKNDIISTIHPTILIEEFIAEEGTYPDNGIQDDYWYIKKGLVETFPAVHVKVGTAIKKATKGYVKTGGVLKEIKEIYVKKDGQLKKGK